MQKKEEKQKGDNNDDGLIEIDTNIKASDVVAPTQELKQEGLFYFSLPNALKSLKTFHTHLHV